MYDDSETHIERMLERIGGGGGAWRKNRKIRIEMRVGDRKKE